MARDVRAGENFSRTAFRIPIMRKKWTLLVVNSLRASTAPVSDTNHNHILL